MSDYMLVKEAARRWHISERRVSYLCKQGQIDGAVKDGKNWMIPEITQKPEDRRVKSGIYKKQPVKGTNILPFPIGISDYRLASTEYYYIDKTLLIKDFLDERPKVSLFTRPRRFGKTLNMDMLRTFFEKSDEDTSIYFKDKKIWSCGTKYQKHQGKYPVIFITFKDVKCNTWDATYTHIIRILQSEFERHIYLVESDHLTTYEKAYFTGILDGTATEVDYMRALLELSQMLDKHHGIAPIIIIDEYDTPIQQGHMLDFYDKVILFMRNLFSGGLKDNRHLSYGFLTGILRVAKESIFSGLNNLKINSVLDCRYSEYFGFTSDEIQSMAKYYGVKDKFEEICQWYNGYRFGHTDIFNPWSVINYFSNGCQPRAYWLSTGSNDIIGEILSQADAEIYEKLYDLLQGKTVFTYIDTGVIYPQIQSNPSSVYSFLLVAGYLKVVQADVFFSDDYMCEVALPNKEISFVYNKEILQKLDHIIPQGISIGIQEALYTNNSQKLQNYLRKLLLQSTSCYDTVGENFYHGLLLGLCAMMDRHYYISSNIESGEGRYDICLTPKNHKTPGVLIELKAKRNCSEEELKHLSLAALKQINDKKYDTNMTAKGISTIFKYGVAFNGKNVEITMA